MQNSTFEASYNIYKISFTYKDAVNGQSDDETISLTFGMQAAASIYYNNETKCNKVNENDILGNLYFYDPSEGTTPMF